VVVVSTLVVETALPVALVAVALARAAVLLLLAGLVLTAAARGGSLPSASPTTLPRPVRVLPLTTAAATTTAGAPTTASSSRVPNTAPSAVPNQYSHPPSPPVVPCGVALQAGEFLLFTDGCCCGEHAVLTGCCCGHRRQ